jgi:ribosomal protein L28
MYARRASGRNNKDNAAAFSSSQVKLLVTTNALRIIEEQQKVET